MTGAQEHITFEERLHELRLLTADSAEKKYVNSLQIHNTAAKIKGMVYLLCP